MTLEELEVQLQDIAEKEEVLQELKVKAAQAIISMRRLTKDVSVDHKLEQHFIYTLGFHDA